MLLALIRIHFFVTRLGNASFIGFAVIAFGVYAAVVIGLEKWRVHRTLRWPTITGAIEDVTTELKDGGNGPDYWRVFFNYVYAVNGQNHSGKYHVNCMSESSSKDAAASFGSAQVIVHYDPKDPAKSVLWEKEVWKLY